MKPPTSAQPPIELEGTVLGKPSTSAAGLTAVKKSLSLTIREMGLARSAKGLLKINQKTGFDCQSCAWPSPDEGRHVAEFCENGAKALADEATLKRIDSLFFEKYTVQELASKSDYWLGQQGRLVGGCHAQRACNGTC